MAKIKSIEERALWKGLLRTERFILVFTSSLLMLIMVASVVMRYILKTDLFGIEEIVTVLAIWLYFIGGVHASYEDSHIKADILAQFVKNKKTMWRINCVVYGLTVAALIILTGWGFSYAQWSIHAGGKTPGWSIPLIISQIPISISFALMLLYSIYHFIKVIISKPVGEGDKT